MIALGLRAAKGGRKWRMLRTDELVRLPEPARPRAGSAFLGPVILLKHPADARLDGRHCDFAGLAVSVGLKLLGVKQLV